MTTHAADTRADTALLARIGLGDERALGELYDRFATLAYSVAFAMLRETADAEEAVGDAFAQIWRSASGFDASRGSTQAWVATIVRSRALDLLRSRRRAAVVMTDYINTIGIDLEAAPADPAQSPAAQAESLELRAQLGAALASLSGPQRRVLELAYFVGLSQSEIAERLGEPLGTVKTRVRTAMEKLRQALAPMRERGDL